jgi:hypothetical protein
MKKILLLILFMFTLVNCSKKTYISSDTTIESTSLDAYSTSNDDKLVQSIINSKNSNSKIKLDGKEYSLDNFKNIMDTISGSYNIILEKYSDKQVINIVRKK